MKKGSNTYLGPSAIKVISDIVCLFSIGIGIFFNSSVVLAICVLMSLLTVSE